MNPAGSSKPQADVATTGLSPEALRAWSTILEARRLVRAGHPPLPGATLAPDSPPPTAVAVSGGGIVWTASAGWEPIPAAQPAAQPAAEPTAQHTAEPADQPVAEPANQAEAQAEVQALLELYLPLLPAQRTATLTLAHLGQSLDGFIATTRGESRFITGPANIRHLHCLRALADAVLVGAETVAADDPRLTTRLVPGDNPVRVILDPRRRLPLERQVFQDGAAPTLLVCAAGPGAPRNWGQAEVVTVAANAEGHLRLDALVAQLHRRGLRRLFVEGGGLTVSRFLAAGLLDRLHLAVAPLVTGEGRRGLSLPASPALAACMRPGCRVFRMGADILFDCEVRAGAGVGTSAGAEPARVMPELRCDHGGATPDLFRIY